MFKFTAVLSAMDESPAGSGHDEEYLLGGEDRDDARKNLCERMAQEGYRAYAVETNNIEVAVDVGGTEIVYLVLEK